MCTLIEIINLYSTTVSGIPRRHSRPRQRKTMIEHNGFQSLTEKSERKALQRVYVARC